MTNYQRSLVRFLAFLLVFQTVLVLVADLTRPPWGDESHFVETVRTFGQGIDSDLLRQYEEMSTPLPFVIYALWGRLVGFDLWQLRILSIIIALATYLLWHGLLFLRLKNRWAVLLASAFLVLHPYMVGLSIFVFTDMLSILFVLLAIHAVISRRPVQLGLALAGAVLCRQYAVFLTLATAVFYLLSWLQNRQDSALRMLASSVLSILPFGCLVILWGGLSPLNKWRLYYFEQGLDFHPEMLCLYLCLMSLFLAPLLIYARRLVYSDWRITAGCFALSFLYWLYPVRASTPAVEMGVDTVGLFHRFLEYTLGHQTAIDIVFQLAFFLSLPLLIKIVKEIYLALSAREYTLDFLLDISIISFLLVMPFSYLGWEKYFMPVLPIVALRIVGLVGQSNNPPYLQTPTEITHTID